MDTPRTNSPFSATSSFDEASLRSLCDHLANNDPELAFVIRTYDYPPFWSRPNSFESLTHIILEQQVSLASALAALNKLKQRFATVTPEAILSLDDQQMRACYVSRQKAGYLRGLARGLAEHRLELEELPKMSNEDIATRLMAFKGVGRWTTDIYLIMVLHRTDIFPIGDIAVINAYKRLKRMDPHTDRETINKSVDAWRPCRTAGTYLLWHYYLSSKATPVLLPPA